MKRVELLHRLRTWLKNERGGVAVIGGVSMVAVAYTAVGAIDYNRVVTAKQQLQDALDAAALAAARSAAETAAEIETLGREAFEANAAGKTVGVDAAADFDLVGNKVVGEATATVQPLTLQPFGDALTVNASTEVKRTTKLEIALVLDNTGSMAGEKLTTLKRAATAFVDQMERAADRTTDENAMKLALVPFSMTVNIGAKYADQPWMDRYGQSPAGSQNFSRAVSRFTLFQQVGRSWAGCVESRPYPYDVRDTAPTGADSKSLFVPFFAPDEPDKKDRFSEESGYKGVNDWRPDRTTSTSWSTRQNNVDKYNGAPDRSGQFSSGYAYGPNAGCALRPVVRLSKDYAGLRAAISAMTAVGDTNIPMGLVWGWHAVSPSAPFSDGAAYDDATVQKIAILMTDGENTNGNQSNNNKSIYSGIGYITNNRLGVTGGDAATRRAAMDRRLSELCANMKAKGVVLYTVRVEVEEGSSAVLENCASGKENFHDVQDVAELGSVFKRIGDSITALRIAK